MKNIFLKRLSEYKDYDWGRDGETLGKLRYNYGISKDNLTQTFGPSVLVQERDIKVIDVPSLEKCLEELPADWPKTNKELGLYIMLKGQSNNYYGTYDERTMHDLLQIALDEVQYVEVPNDEQWLEFAGTFNESDVFNKLSMKIHTKKQEFEFGIDMPRIADLLNAAEGYFLNQLT